VGEKTSTDAVRFAHHILREYLTASIAVAKCFDRSCVQGTRLSKGALVEQASCLIGDGGQDARPTRAEALRTLFLAIPIGNRMLSS